MADRTIAVNADALHQVLQALIGPGHLIRELQFTRSLHKLGHLNAIETLIEDYKRAASPAVQPAAERGNLTEEQRTDLLAAALYISARGDETSVLSDENAERIAELLCDLSGFDLNESSGIGSSTDGGGK